MGTAGLTTRPDTRLLKTPVILLVMLWLYRPVLVVASPAVTITREPIKAHWRTTADELLDCGDGDRYTGMTDWFFHCQPRFEHTVISEKQDAGKFQTKIRITAVSMKLSLSVKTVCGTSDRTRLHEEGHVEICRRIYQRYAEKSAKTSCASVIGKSFSGSGSTKKQSLKAARREASIFVCRQYSRGTAGLADCVQRAYDEITVHGRNNIPSLKGVEDAFKRVEAGAGSKF